MSESVQPDKSIAELLGELTEETSLLFRHEVALARAEMTQTLSRLGSGAATLVVGGILLVLSLQALLAAAIIALAQTLGWWQSALILGVAVLLIGTAILMRGLASLRAEQLAPRRTLASLRGNTQWAKEQLR